MMDTSEKLVQEVLACANSVAGTAQALSPDGDLAIEAFEFDSLSLFAFIMELERVIGVPFDDVMLNHEQLQSIRSTAAVAAALLAKEAAHAAPAAGTESAPSA